MWKGREIVLCALAVLAGNMLGDALLFPPLAYLLMALIFSVLVALRRLRWYLLLTCLILLGAAAVQLGRMPGMQQQSALMQWAASCKSAFSAWLGRLLPEGDELAVLRALLIGDRSGLTRDLRAAYRDSGAMHLLALSGLHVGLIYALLAWLLRPLGGHRAARLLRSTALLGLLWTYALITGLSASISRAVLMITFYELAACLSGDRDSLSALAGSALLLMLLRPESPRDIGFQLSYTAVLSILLLHPWLKDLLQTRSRLLRRIWELLSVSLCCQLSCGVLAWIYFGTFPRYFLLTALLAIPVTTAVMYASAATVALAGLSSFAARCFPIFGACAVTDWLSSVPAVLSGHAARLLAWLVHLLNALIHLIASL